jgi:DNA-binding SARP family transcriptional activator
VLGIGESGARREAAAALAASEREGDRWGCALAGLALGQALAYGGHADAAAVLRRSSADLHVLGATVLEAWATGLAAFALARAGDPEARAETHVAERAARSAGIRAPFAFTYLALAALEPGRRAEYVALASDVAEECGLTLPGMHAQAVGARVALSCLGAFTLTVEGAPVDLSPVRPRARQLLRTLALHGGRPVHREVLQEQLWPDATADGGRRTLQVAISALRAVLPAPLDVVREDEAYRLALPPDVELDLAELDDALARARRARVDGDLLAAEAAWQRAVDVGSAGDVLPEDGPAEWVVDERERRRTQVSAAAESLARSLLERGEAAAAVAACEHGLDRDRHRDALWRLLISAREQAGDLALAVQARRDYERLLGTLERPTARAPATPQA